MGPDPPLLQAPARPKGGGTDPPKGLEGGAAPDPVQLAAAVRGKDAKALLHLLGPG